MIVKTIHNKLEKAGVAVNGPLARDILLVKDVSCLLLDRPKTISQGPQLF